MALSLTPWLATATQTRLLSPVPFSRVVSVTFKPQRIQAPSYIQFSSLNQGRMHGKRGQCQQRAFQNMDENTFTIQGDQDIQQLKKAVIQAVANTNRGKDTTANQKQNILRLIEVSCWITQPAPLGTGYFPDNIISQCIGPFAVLDDSDGEPSSSLLSSLCFWFQHDLTYALYAQHEFVFALLLFVALEACNPTTSPVDSPLLSGFWSLLYTAPIYEEEVDKYAGAEEGPFLARFKPLSFGSIRQTASFQVIDTGDGIVQNIAEFIFFGMKGSLVIEGKAIKSSTFEKESVRIEVTFESFFLRIGKWQSPTIPLDWVNPKGWVDTTFLDQDLRVGRGDKGSIFVSARVKKQ